MTGIVHHIVEHVVQSVHLGFHLGLAHVDFVPVVAVSGHVLLHIALENAAEPIGFAHVAHELDGHRRGLDLRGHLA